MLSRPAVRAISSRQNAIVKLFQQAARRASDDDLVLLDGAHLLVDADAAGVAITHIVHSDDVADAAVRRVLARAEQQGAHVASATDAVMAALSPAHTSSGIVALARRPHHDGAAVVSRAPQLLLSIVGVQDPGNVGALIRSAEAAGATGVLVSGASADPFGWKALRGAMGSAFRLPVATAVGALDAVRLARERGVRVVASTPREGQPLFDVDFRRPLMIVLGGEGPGLPEDVLALADATVTIPMAGHVESLNVGVAGALLLYEAFRQRT